MTIKTKTRLVGAICALAVAGFAPAAYAQTAAQEGYDESGLLGSVDQGGSGPAQSVSGSSQGGSLPFTGLDLGILVALGGTAAGAGYMMRRTLRNPAQ